MGGSRWKYGHSTSIELNLSENILEVVLKKSGSLTSRETVMVGWWVAGKGGNKANLSLNLS